MQQADLFLSAQLQPGFASETSCISFASITVQWGGSGARRAPPSRRRILRLFSRNLCAAACESLRLRIRPEIANLERPPETFKLKENPQWPARARTARYQQTLERCSRHSRDGSVSEDRGRCSPKPCIRSTPASIRGFCFCPARPSGRAAKKDCCTQARARTRGRSLCCVHTRCRRGRKCSHKRRWRRWICLRKSSRQGRIHFRNWDAEAGQERDTSPIQSGAPQPTGRVLAWAGPRWHAGRGAKDHAGESIASRAGGRTGAWWRSLIAC